MRNNSFYYKLAGVDHMTFDTIGEARRIGREWLAFDRPLSSQIRGAGCRIMRVNAETGKVRYYKI